MNREELAATIHRLAVEVLSCEPDEVKPESSFYQLCGGDSLKLLDLSFRIERALGVRIEFGQLVSRENVQVDKDGNITAESRRWLAERYPFLKIETLRSEANIDSLLNLLTIDAITRLVERELEAPDRNVPSSKVAT